MGRKTILEPFKLIDNQSIATSVTSAQTNIRQIDNVKVEVEWNTGSSLSGSISVEVASLLKDGVSVSSWKALDFGTSISISGASGSHILNIINPNSDLIRVKYTSSAGTGYMTVYISGKVVGA